MEQKQENGFLPRMMKFLRPAGPWAFYIGLFLVLRYTGALGSISTVAQSALFKTGVMDATPEDPVGSAAAKKFNYDFSLYDVNGNKVDVTSFKGKVIFINLWATWCGPCRVEMPSIQNLYNSVDKDKIVFVMLALDQKDPFNKVNAYIRDKEFTFPIYFPATALPEMLQVRSIPTTFVINAEGEVVHKQMGTANYDTDEFRTFLKNL
jgi:thiol-disulfide isomerase/thioredoxin